LPEAACRDRERVADVLAEHGAPDEPDRDRPDLSLLGTREDVRLRALGHQLRFLSREVLANRMAGVGELDSEERDHSCDGQADRQPRGAAAKPTRGQQPSHPAQDTPTRRDRHLPVRA